jgi:glutamyl/glutaminyl-tRNA synthetase
MTQEAFEKVLLPFVPSVAALEPALRSKVSALLKERVSTLLEAKNLMEAGEFDWLLKEPEYEPSKLLWKTEQEPAKARERLQKALEIIQTIPSGELTKDSAKAALWPYAEEVGRGAVLWPLRFALSGREKSPDPFVLLELLGKETSIRRITNAINRLA